MRNLAYDLGSDAVDEYSRLGETTTSNTLKRFASATIHIYGNENLREPSADDVKRHLQENSDRGFTGMFSSIDCTNWEWKTCPVAWQSHYQDRNGSRSIVLEVIATKNL